jgi:hypothetical protein
MRIYKCDRCKKEVALIWIVNLAVENLNPAYQFIPTEKIEICFNCKTNFVDWIDRGVAVPWEG